MSDTDELHEDRPWKGEWWPAAQMLDCDPAAEAVTAAISTWRDETDRKHIEQRKIIASLFEERNRFEQLACRYRAERDLAHARLLRLQP